MPLRDIDRKLLDRCLEKEPGAWNDFVDRYVGLIYHVIYHVAHARSLPISTVDVEDVAAEVLLKIVDDDYALLRKFKGMSSLATYLTIVARRVAMKKMIRRQRAAELGHAHAHRAGMNDDHTDEAESIATAEEVHKMLEALTDREAEVVRMYHLQFLNYRQIGKKLGISENSVGPILANARKRLRNAAEQRSA